MGWIATIPPWQWLVLGVVLLTLESLGIGGFFIGLAIACLVQSIVVYAFPGLSWSFQLFVFAVNALVFTFLYWKVFKPFNTRTDQPSLNNRAAQLIGRKVLIQENLPHGEGKVMIGDTYWRIRAEGGWSNGDSVTGVGSDGRLLLVEKN